ncbi:MAG: CDP-glucose 4,6-dehydratase [Victivallaceae bacterium]|nr:CDP-glucose 4,6-dehydratase [Victivallaceae bacterium]
MFADIYRSRRVLVTGHTGFKGSWLALWLRQLGAEVCGVALSMPSPNHWESLKLEIRSEMADICDLALLLRVFGDFKPEIVFHLAAQPLVLDSYRDPVGTFRTNVMGTVNVLEGCRRMPSVRAAVVVTSDKCYENRGGERCRESDPMGGFDPYSASKGCAELVVSSYRRSFFGDGPLVASARAGNAVGGGDWGADRLVPDIMRAAAAGRPAAIRNPGAVRPWQHVLDPLSGYLALGQRLLEGRRGFAGAWNFGPDASGVTVGELVGMLSAAYPEISFETAGRTEAPHEASSLCLDCSKARELLQWRPVWTTAQAAERTARWYRNRRLSGRGGSLDDLNEYVAAARREGLEWTV